MGHSDIYSIGVYYSPVYSKQLYKYMVFFTFLEYPLKKRCILTGMCRTGYARYSLSKKIAIT